MTGTENTQVSHLPTMCTNAATTKAMNLHAWTVRLLRLLQITICSFLVYLLHNFNIITLPWKLTKCGLRSRGPFFRFQIRIIQTASVAGKIFITRLALRRNVRLPSNLFKIPASDLQAMRLVRPSGEKRAKSKSTGNRASWDGSTTWLPTAQTTAWRKITSLVTLGDGDEACSS